MEWRIDESGPDGFDRVTLKGDLDLYSAPGFYAEMSARMDGGRVKARFDFSGVTYLDSSGVGAVIKLLQNSRRMGGELRFAGVGGSPRKVLRMSNILPLMREEPMESQA